MKWEWWQERYHVQDVWTCDLEAARTSAFGVEARMLEANVAARCRKLIAKYLFSFNLPVPMPMLNEDLEINAHDVLQCLLRCLHQMRKDALRLLVAHDVHRWDNGATPLPVLEVRAYGA